MDSPTGEFCRALGKELAERTRAVLVTGGCKCQKKHPERMSVDWYTTEAAEVVLKERGEESSRIETLLPDKDPGDIEKFSRGRTSTLIDASPQARRFRLLASVDVLVSIAGGTGTRQHLDLALAIERPILPLPWFGGESFECWQENQVEIVRLMALSDDDVTILKENQPGLPADENQRATLPRRVVEMLSRRLTKTCMVIMPFAADLKPFYTDVIAPAIKANGLHPMRTDTLNIPANIPDTIVRGIENCQCAIAVLKDLKPNVFYEIGLAHAHGKPVILLAPNDMEVPFDIRHHSYLPYSEDDRDLVPRIGSQLASLGAVTSPRWRLKFSKTE